MITITQSPNYASGSELDEPTSGRWEAGFKCGESLQQCDRPLSELASSVTAELESAASAARTLIVGFDERLTTLKSQRDRWGTFRDTASSYQSDLLAHRRKCASDYSVWRAALFLMLSLLLLLGDVGILGRVLADFVGEDYYSSDAGGDFLLTLVSQGPLAAFRYFPGLFGLVLSILVMGFYLKLWEEHLRTISSLEDSSAKSLPVEKWMNAIYLVVLILSILSVIGSAGIRLVSQTASEAPINGISTAAEFSLFKRFVMSLLGLALPYVSAAFFIKGSDKLGKSMRLWRETVKERYFDHNHRLVEKSIQFTSQRLTLAQQERDLLASETYQSSRLKKVKSSFTAGYRAGVLSALTSSDVLSLSNRLRPVALRNALLSSPEKGA